MKISFITVCLDAKSKIGHTIETLLSQQCAQRERLIISGASIGASAALGESITSPGIRAKSKPESGIYDPFIKALAISNGEALGFIDADDRLHDGSGLAHVADTLDIYEAFHGDIDCNDAGGHIDRCWRTAPRPRADFAPGWIPARPTLHVRHLTRQTPSAPSVCRFKQRPTQTGCCAPSTFMARTPCTCSTS